MHRPSPWDDTGNKLAVAAIRDAEALPELMLFQGQLEGELREVKGSKHHESPAMSEQPRNQDQAHIHGI